MTLDRQARDRVETSTAQRLMAVAGGDQRSDWPTIIRMTAVQALVDVLAVVLGKWIVIDPRSCLILIVRSAADVLTIERRVRYWLVYVL